MVATITVQGGLTAVPELKFGQNGTAVLTGTVASTERIYDRKDQAWRDGKTLYQRFVAFGTTAENINASNFGKGTQVVVTGKLSTREYQTKQGENRSITELEVTDFAASVKHATVQVTKTSRGGAQPQTWGMTPAQGVSAVTGDPGVFGGVSDGFADEQPF